MDNDCDFQECSSWSEWHNRDIMCDWIINYKWSLKAHGVNSVKASKLHWRGERKSSFSLSGSNLNDLSILYDAWSRSTVRDEMFPTQCNFYFGEKNREVLSIHRKAHYSIVFLQASGLEQPLHKWIEHFSSKATFSCFSCDFVILCLLQMKSFPSFLTSCEVGKTSGRSPARLGLIIISTNFDQIYRTLCHQTAAPHCTERKKIFNFIFALFLICFAI